MPLPISLLEKSAPGLGDITICQGDTWYQSFVIRVNGSIVDLTGFTASLVVRASYGGAVLATAACTIPLGTAGAIIARMTPLVTEALSVPGALATQRLAQLGFYDLDLTDGVDRVTLFTGVASLSREVTV